MVAVHVEHLELGGLRATQRLQELTYLTGTVGEGEGRGGGVASLGGGAYVFTAARSWLGGRHVLPSARDRLTVRGHTYVCTCYGVYCRKVRCMLVTELAVVLTEAAACPESGGLHRSSTTGASSVQEVKNSSSFAP